MAPFAHATASTRSTTSDILENIFLSSYWALNLHSTVAIMHNWLEDQIRDRTSKEKALIRLLSKILWTAELAIAQGNIDTVSPHLTWSWGHITTWNPYFDQFSNFDSWGHWKPLPFP